ncbi:DnaB-like helicase C-terminal domain-containing protein [Candidatus Phytoplasma tritici]|uniref:DnaB-like helicase C-terminal domain-containing protein n=1 Tax=Candidatus Phytoplasma tritici TaxID=321961 RepID=UPI0004182D03|nr:DnaB-like helicase C-terminal domain-containing protein [Candidatus Phytoplasma tritici]
MAFIPHPSDKTLLTLNQMASCHPEFFQFDQQAKQKIQEEYYRLVETFKGLNQATKGFKKGQIIIIGGYTGLGKTTFVYNLLIDISKTKHQQTNKHPNILVFSYEMTLEENLSRLLANITRFPLDLILDKNLEDYTINDVIIHRSEYLLKMEIAKDFFHKLIYHLVTIKAKASIMSLI